MAATVLIADDDPDILELVARLLQRAGHDVVRARDGQEALQALWERRPDLVILDIGMPKLGGWQVLERIREVSRVPVLMLTAEGEELDRVRGLTSGADDFVTKPFGRQELVARVTALLRRSGWSTADGEAPDVTRAGRLEVDHAQRRATLDGAELALTPMEFKLLAALVRNPRQVLSSERLIDLVWDDPYTAGDQVKLLVGRLRRKLRDALADDPIETVRGFGYRFSPPG